MVTARNGLVSGNTQSWLRRKYRFEIMLSGDIIGGVSVSTWGDYHCKIVSDHLLEYADFHKIWQLIGRDVHKYSWSRPRVKERLGKCTYLLQYLPLSDLDYT